MEGRGAVGNPGWLHGRAGAVRNPGRLCVWERRGGGQPGRLHGRGGPARIPRETAAREMATARLLSRRRSVNHHL